jgi:nitrite reductase/ring-hydroxylating ferredoxin subunit
VIRDGEQHAARDLDVTHVAAVRDVPPGTLRAVTLASGARVCLANLDGEILAVRDECSHQAFPLSEGTLLPGGILECAWHGARFDCRTGAVVGPPAEEPVARYATTVRDGLIYVHEEIA